MIIEDIYFGINWRLKMKLLSRFFKDESGVTAIEYGLIAALVAVVVIAALNTLGTEIEATFTGVTDAIVDARP